MKQDLTHRSALEQQAELEMLLKGNRLCSIKFSQLDLYIPNAHKTGARSLRVRMNGVNVSFYSC